MKKLLPFLLSTFCFQLFGATLCVGPSATGNGSGSDWSNQKAWGNTMARGDTWYLRGGSGYADLTFTGPASSGTTRCTIKKATAGSHVTETGWVSAYGTDQAVCGILHIDSTSSGYWTFDGVTQWGIKFRNTSGAGIQIFNFLHGGANSIVNCIEIAGPGGSVDYNYDGETQGLACWGDGAGGTLISSNYIHGVVTGVSWSTPTTFEYNIIADCLSDQAVDGADEPHSNVFYCGFDASDIIFRYNICTNYNDEGFFMTWYSTGPPHEISIYGNIFSSPGTYNPRGIEIREGSGSAYRNILIYNNTFVDLANAGVINASARLGPGCIGCIAYNNLGRNADFVYYVTEVGYGQAGFGNFTAANNIVGAAATVFVNVGAKNFHLAAATAAGTSLSSPYNKDRDGVTRGADGVWDIGAYDFVGGPDVTAPTHTGATISASGNTVTMDFSEAVSFGAGGSAGWALTLSGGAVTLTYSSGSGSSSWVYTTSRTVLQGETVSSGLNYTQPSNGIEDAAGNDLVTFTGHSVVNNSTYTQNPPEVTSGNAVGTKDSAFSYQIAGDNTPTAFGVVSNMPTGLSVNGSSGIISGVPTVLQTNQVGLAISNSFGFDIEAVTFTIIPPSTNIFFGNTNDGGSIDTISANSINGFRWYATNDIVCSTLYAKVQAVTGHEKMALYTDSGSLPNIKLGDTAERTNPTNGWNSFVLNSPVTLTNGNWYWIFLWSDADASVYYSAGSVTFRYGTLTYGSWPSPITLASAGSPIAYSMYAAGTPPGGQLPSDTTLPTISAFDIPTTSSSIVVPITTLTVTDTPATPAVEYFASTTGVSGNNGLTTGTPKDLTSALNLLAPGVTVSLMDGVWGNGTAYRITGKYGYSTNPATVRAINKWKAVIANATNDAIEIYADNPGEGSYLVLDGLCISNALDSGINILNPANTVRNCWIVDNRHHGIDGNSNNVIEMNLIELNGYGHWTNSVVNGYGFYQSGANCIFRNNVIRNNKDYGIHYYAGSLPNHNNNTQIYGNLVYGHTNFYGVTVWGAIDPGGALPGTNYIYGNTILDGLQLNYGAAWVTNNIILPSPFNPTKPISTGTVAAVTLRADYNIGTNAMVVVGPHDFTTNYAGLGFVNPSTGLYWLTNGSAARGRALTTVYGPLNFFGNAQSSVSDVGAFQYSSTLAADTRVLEPASSTFSAVNYWPPNVSYYLSETGTTPAVGAAGWTLTAPVTVTFAGDGARTAYLWVKDTSGNISSRAEDSVTITYPVSPSVPSVSALSATAPP